MAILIFLTSKHSLVLLNINKELKLVFSPHHVYDIWNSMIKTKKKKKKNENYSAMAPHLFLLQVYTEW